MKQILSSAFLSIRIVIFILAGVAAVIGFIFWTFNRPPVNLDSLEHLKQGMSKDEVQRVLGKPIHETFNSWTYSRKGGWSIVYVYFNDDGEFKESEYER